MILSVSRDLRLDGVAGLIAASVTRGADAIQIREPNISSRALWAIVSSAVSLTRGTPVQIIVNERVDVALAAGADGVQLGASGPPVSAVRAIVPAGFLIGRSAHSDEEIDRATGADYLVFGTVFSTPSKPGVEGQGLDALRRAVQRFRGPVLAIGGITPANSASVLATGAAGYAAIGAFAV